jgi:Glycosyltransferase family 28 C-terminal domain.
LVKLWFKECFRSNPAIEYYIKENKYSHVFQFIKNISVYNESMKKALIAIDKSNSKKITVNGCPRIYDYLIKKKYNKKIKDILFLSFHLKGGISPSKKSKSLNWNLSYDKTIKILNELSNHENLNIIIKRKKSRTIKTKYKINKKIKIFDEGSAQKYIHQADIIIGHNSASTIEALINGKHVLIPFFENKKNLKKYLFNFNKEIVYNSEKEMKKKILSLIDKKFMFPLKNTKNLKTINKYYGNSKNIIKKYENFLNC